MFVANGLFSGIECPSIRLKIPCELSNCSFCHDCLSKEELNADASSSTVKRSKESTRSTKRQRTQPHLENTGDELSQPLNDSHRPRVDNKTSLSLTQSLESEGATVNDSKRGIASSTNTYTTSSLAHPEALKTSVTKDYTKLLPTVLQSSPAVHQQRVNYLKVIHQTFVSKGNPRPIFSAVEAEEKVARDSSKITYPQNIRILVKNIKQGTYGKDLAKEKYALSKLKPRLERMVIPVEVLESYGYVTKPVVAKDLQSQFTTKCVRCGAEFNTSDKRKVECRYHALRPIFEYDYHESKKKKSYGCCSEVAEHTQGCCVSDRHVFKLNSAEEMASAIPFTHTAKDVGPNTLFAAGIDCEMGYTTLGMELIRVTVVDWETNKKVLDRQVFPYGTVIDLNSRFSGVHSLEEGIKNENGVISPTISFKEARKLIDKYVSQSTILIGHGFENDLNTMRLVHHRVIDTALMYPTFKPVRRSSLKHLAFKYLSRTIQQGEHDSSEDAIAAMDIVTHHIKQAIDRGLS